MVMIKSGHLSMMGFDFGFIADAAKSAAGEADEVRRRDLVPYPVNTSRSGPSVRDLSERYDGIPQSLPSAIANRGRDQG
jgi:hypothetical protein